MQDQDQIGRCYAGQVQRIISGSIGLDDWEWGVDL
jgi:chlorite dismutase